MIGVDVISMDRITKLKAKFGKRFLGRFLNEKELSLAKNDASIAGFWAIKEATAKALGCGICKDCDFSDISIFKSPLGAPCVKISKHARLAYKKRKQKSLKKRAFVSLSHDGGIAIAVVKLRKKQD